MDTDSNLQIVTLVDQSVKDRDMKRCSFVSTPGLSMTGIDLSIEERLPQVLSWLYRRVTGRLRTTTRWTTNSATAGKRHELTNKHSFDMSETTHASSGEHMREHAEVQPSLSVAGNAYLTLRPHSDLSSNVNTRDEADLESRVAIFRKNVDVPARTSEQSKVRATGLFTNGVSH